MNELLDQCKAAGLQKAAQIVSTLPMQWSASTGVATVGGAHSAHHELADHGPLHPRGSAPDSIRGNRSRTCHSRLYVYLRRQHCVQARRVNM